MLILPFMSYEALKSAIEIAGGPVELAKLLRISSQAISQWRRAPAGRVLEIERNTGVSRYDLRPDIYGPAPIQSEAA